MSNRTHTLVAPLFAALLLIAFASPARAAYHALETLPVESPVYRMVEDLAASYGFTRRSCTRSRGSAPTSDASSMNWC